jgi:hypothetical protein
VLEGHPIEKLHGDECFLVLFADFVDSADVGMVQGRRSLCLAFETRQSLRVTGNIIGQEFQSRKPVQ